MLLEKVCEKAVSENPLGRTTEYIDQYSPDLLYSIPRQPGRDSLGLKAELPFSGVDIWHAYELSWLNNRGKPLVAVGEFRFPASSPNIIESKSLKLYLNSLNGMKYASQEFVESIVKRDLEHCCGSEVEVRFSSVAEFAMPAAGLLPGVCIDELDVKCSAYEVEPTLLNSATETGKEIEDVLHSHLLRSKCPITGQPDWASVLISYRGQRIRPEVLLKYLIAYRNHDEFHEHCVERIFVDINNYCRPAALTVYARYARRGGLDISPFRSNFEMPSEKLMVWR